MKYTEPKIDLLKTTNKININHDEKADDIGAVIVDTFNSFGIEVDISEYKCSPINIIFELRLRKTARYKDIKACEEDLSVCLGRVVKVFQRSETSNVFSVSVLRYMREYVALRDLIDNSKFKKAKSNLYAAVGIDEHGDEYYLDLEQAPHLLISGTTGSGKTILMDDIIVSILYRSSPLEVNFVLIDPEGKDFNSYAGLPHLLCPVVKNTKNAVEIVEYLCSYMSSTFDMFSDVGAKDIDTYNSKVVGSLPRIVVAIDKYYDFVNEKSKRFEDCLFELSRKGRAAGIHLIINTQSARSDVISGNIKANISCRAALSSLDWRESKAMLDKTGAQKLLGNGDLLITMSNAQIPSHVQTAYISEAEIDSIVRDIRKNNIVNMGDR